MSPSEDNESALIDRKFDGSRRFVSGSGEDANKNLKGQRARRGGRGEAEGRREVGARRRGEGETGNL